MNKKLLKVFICTLILLIGIGVASAIEYNSTDDVISINDNSGEVLSVENNDEVISISDNSSEILNSENSNDEILAINENNTEVLNAENKNDEVISISVDNNEILNVKNNNEVLSVNNKNVNDTNILGSSTGVISFCPPDDMSGMPVTQEYEHTFFKIKFPKKYWKYMKMSYKKTPKKFKKWFKKIYKKKFKKAAKKLIKKVKVNAKYHWKPKKIKYFKYPIGKRYCLSFYLLFYRTYYYNLDTNTFCWKT